MRSPQPEEFDESGDSVTHSPTEYIFHPRPGHPAQGRVRMGLLDKDMPDDPAMSATRSSRWHANYGRTTSCEIADSAAARP